MPYPPSTHPKMLQPNVPVTLHVNVPTYARLFVHNFSTADMWVTTNKTDPVAYADGAIRIRAMTSQGWSPTAFSGDVEVRAVCSVATEVTVQAL